MKSNLNPVWLLTAHHLNSMLLNTQEEKNYSLPSPEREGAGRGRKGRGREEKKKTEDTGHEVENSKLGLVLVK